MQVHIFQPDEWSDRMNRLVKQSIAAAASLLLASAAHASLVTYEFTGVFNIGPMGDLPEVEAFSGSVSFHDGLRDRDHSDTHGQYVDRRRSAVFETRIGDQSFIVRGGRHGEIDLDIYNNDPSVGGGADGLGIFASNQFLSMGFFQLYDPADFPNEVFHSDRIPRITPPVSGSGGFFIDEGAGGIFSGWLTAITCTTCAPTNSVPEPGTLTLSVAGLLMMGYAVRRRRRP
jgi:hypothetical protein